MLKKKPGTQSRNAQEMGLSSCKEGCCRCGNSMQRQKNDFCWAHGPQSQGIKCGWPEPCTNPQDFLPPIALVRCRTTSKTLWNPPSQINLLVFGKLAKRSPRKISILSLRIKSKNIFSLRIKSLYSSFGSFCQRKLEKKLQNVLKILLNFFLNIFQLNVSK